MKEYKKPHLSEKWMKAAVVGSLWASVEIILGSWLHNLRIPFAGSALSFFTVYLVISFFQVWKTNGLIWRAGLICALMKSISPSAIILGPMIGILSQAFVLELSIRLLGKNLFAYTVGGALAVFSALVQKAFTLLVLYGWDFISLLEDMYTFSLHSIGLESARPLSALIFISIAYLSAGSLAGWFGFKAGNAYIMQKEHAASFTREAVPGQSNLFTHTTKSRSVLILFAYVLMLISGMLIINTLPLFYSLIIIPAFVLLAYKMYPNNLKYLKKPGMWLQFGFIILLSAMFKNGMEQLLNPEGFYVGLKMVVRALLLLSGFAAISAELKNPIVKNVLYNRGLKNLYLAVELSFAALPDIMNSFFNEGRNMWRYKNLTHVMLKNSAAILNSFLQRDQPLMPVFILTGKVNQGKTTLTHEIVLKLQERGYDIKGFTSLCKSDHLNRDSYVIRNIETGREDFFCSMKPDPQKLHFGRFFFEENGIRAGRLIITKSTEYHTDLLVIDELGPIEITGKGWAPSIQYVVEQNAMAQLWIVREKLVKPMMRKWNIGDVTVFHPDEDTTDQIVQVISNKIEQAKNLIPKRLYGAS